MIGFEGLLKAAVGSGASDLHITAGLPPMLRVTGTLRPMDDDLRRLSADDTERLVMSMMSKDNRQVFDDEGHVDFSMGLPGIGRFRVNAYKQRGALGAAIRIIPFDVPNLRDLGLPQILEAFAGKRRGFVVVTGPTGSGKSTTLAAMVGFINSTRNCHVMTIEDPIEYLHQHKKAIVNQREIGEDAKSFPSALRAALREDPDVILVGEMRDLETMATAITAAETGHLVLASLHTGDAVQTVDRIIDVFPEYQQDQIRVQLAGTLEAVIAQQLIPRKDKPGRVPAVEIMVGTPAVRNLIREGKTHQLRSMIQTGARFGMQTLEHSLRYWVEQGVVSNEDALAVAVDADDMKRLLRAT
ncbi:MAG: type IV pilus twitching motility protein PilT [Firmicutes bacterium]|nr:type IV pilus twitching motility protein PilT [Bacillota bacterium]